MKKEVRAALGFQMGHVPHIITKPLKQHFHLENNFKICVSGSAGGNIAEEGMQGAYELGRQIGLRGVILLTGATTGIPFIAAKGNFDVGGLAIGFSPASSAIEHVKSYKLPTDYHDVIVYTGFNYSGRNLLLTRASDAVITVNGRIGSLNEFTIAFEDKKICGVLEGTGGMADHIRKLLEIGKRGSDRVIFSRDPGELVHLVIERLKAGFISEGGTHKPADSF
ncbi:MAG: hypothetical protein WCJ29_03910 [bacterium]